MSKSELSVRIHLGNNLEFLRMMEPESVDLVYLDPPFNSGRNYGEGERIDFRDTWKWDETAEIEIQTARPYTHIFRALLALLGRSHMLAYLAFMAPRLAESRRVMKETATIILHCDPTASHYLKLVLDGLFGAAKFQNEIIWQRTTPKGLQTKRLPTNHDVLLVYQKGESGTWNGEATFSAYDADNLDEKTASQYTLRDSDGRQYQLTSLTNPNRDRPNLTYEFLGVTRVWRWTEERMRAAHRAGLVVQGKAGNVPRYKRYLDEQRGRPLGDVWVDIPPVNSRAAESLGYPTQKPVALLERVISIWSNPGDMVLDPFCGSGTTCAVATRLGRRGIGIDENERAVSLARGRIAEVAKL